MVWFLCQFPRVLSEALGKEKVYIRTIEYPLFDGDRVDILAQDHQIFSTGPDTTCYVIEVKSDKGDHEILGQLKKATIVLQRTGESTGHWKRTVGIAIAKKYTKSGLSLLLDAGMLAFLWCEEEKSGRIWLTPAQR